MYRSGSAEYVTTYNNTYNSSGNLIRCSSQGTTTDGYTFKTETSYEYDKNGNRTKATEYYELGETTTLYSYDETNRLTREETISNNYYTDKKQTVSIIDYSYDYNNNIISKFNSSSEGDIFTEYEYEYDEYENILKKVTYENDYIVSEEYYEYGEYGNIITKTTYDKNGYIDTEEEYSEFIFLYIE